MSSLQSFEREMEMSPWLSRATSPLGSWSHPVSTHYSTLTPCFLLVWGLPCPVCLLWPHALVLPVTCSSFVSVSPEQGRWCSVEASLPQTFSVPTERLDSPRTPLMGTRYII